jgi:hypothetical protein
MRSWICLHVLAAAWFFAAARGAAAELLVEAESFADHGGWLVDCQFTHIMGSPYLLAHGLGQPVSPATTRVAVPAKGTYRMWVRTKDWAPPHAPGRFRIVVDGHQVDAVFGATGDDWAWQDAGLVELPQETVALELVDLTGFDGRCDALFFTTNHEMRPPNSPGRDMAAWRRSLLRLPATPPRAGDFDLVVVGGGLAGCSAAVAAARLGLEVALIQERPVLGGNASSEIGIHPVGLSHSIVDEIAGAERHQIVQSQQRLHLFLNWQAVGVTMNADRIVDVHAKHTSTGEERSFAAPVFADCTGDAWIGYWAGADYRMGREGRDEFDESMAPPHADRMTHGATLFFHIELETEPVVFPDVPWATEVSRDHVDVKSDHSWEYGHRRDMIRDAERIRDYLFRAIYGSFATVKQRFPNGARNARLARVAHVAARGESRRLMGDLILTENDIRAQREFPDSVAQGGIVFCLHEPREDFDFRSNFHLTPTKPYGIPFRCLYSRNVANLMMAGRNASATHVAYASIKLMKTGGQMGVAVGSAAALCKKYGIEPRDVGAHHIGELRALVLEQPPLVPANRTTGN